jgi:hypothetical protein
MLCFISFFLFSFKSNSRLMLSRQKWLAVHPAQISISTVVNLKIKMVAAFQISSLPVCYSAGTHDGRTRDHRVSGHRASIPQPTFNASHKRFEL